MMNGVALLLVIFSLAGAGVWSPAPARTGAVPGDHRRGDGDNGFGEGHRMIIVEYERESPNRRRSHASPLESISAAVEEVKEKLAEASSVMPNLGQGISTPLAQEKTQIEETQRKHSAKEIICDAYGVCKEKISELIGKSKEKAAKLEEGAIHAEEEVAEKAKEIRRNVTEKAMEMRNNVTEILRRAKDLVYEAAAVQMPDIKAVAHLLGFATAYGTSVWVSFISSQVLASALSRHQFGVLQSKLYPAYFQVMAYSVGLAALTATEGSPRWIMLFSLALVLVNLFLLEPKATKTMFEKMKLEKEEGRGRDVTDVETETTTSTTRTATATPTTTTVGVTKTTLTHETLTEKEDLKGMIEKLNDRLRALNNCSSFVNVLSLMALSWHLVNLGRRLQGSCEPGGPR